MITDLLPTEDQSMIQESVAGFLADRLPPDRLRETSAMAGGAERAVWAGLAEIGLFGLGVAEAAGGVGYGLPEEVIAARELGRALASPSVLATMLAAHAAAASGDAALLAALASGERRAAFINADKSAGGVLLVDAEGADQLFGWSETGASLIPASAAAGRTLKAGLDETVSLEQTRLASAEADGSQALAWRADLLASAYLAGIAEAALAMAVEYAKERKQFDIPIGAFQAIKHACADMAVRAESARAQTFYAALAVETADADAAVDVAAARLIARRAAIENAKANIHIHGAMGFTQEALAHLYLKRALTMAALNSSLARDLARLTP